jgi:streptogramin lyase
VLVRAVGAGVAVDAIGYNWNLFLAARGETRPQLITSLLAAAWLVCIVIPLLLLFGINGAAASIVVLSTAGYLMRSYYMRRLFGPFFMVGVVWRQLTAALIAAAAVLAVRRIGWDVHDVGGLAGQGAFFLAVFALLAFALGRAPILEVWRALRAEPAPPSQAAVAASTVGVMPTPRPMAFPLGLAFDADGPRGPAVWVTTRDWPALGRFDVDDGRWTWTELPPFPHVPTPDGRGGCWTALSRSSAVAHIDGNGDVRRIDVGSSRELLVSALGSGALWVVDAHQRELITIDLETEAFERLSLPASMHRPDYVAALSDGAVWVADTQSRIVARLDPTTREMDEITVPHPTRALRADARRHGVWLGASDRPCLTLLGRDGRVRRSVDLSGVPFGIDLSEDGRLFVALKDEDSIAVVHPDAEVVDVLPVRQGSVPMTVAVGAGRCFVALAHSSEIGVLPLSAPTHDAEAAWQARPDGLVTPTGLGGLPASPPPPLVD